MKGSSKSRGFTLVELAIGLTIIGLILGGLLIGGSSVLENARVNDLLSQIKDLGTASRDFKTRYGYLPGDLPIAATIITTDGGISAACTYNASVTVGNGVVDTATESACAIEHLVKARLISKTVLNGSNYEIPHPFGGGVVSISEITATHESAIQITNLPCHIALRIDSKLDSEVANPLGSGIVTGWDSTGTAINTCTPNGLNDPVANLRVRF